MSRNFQTYRTLQGSVVSIDGWRDLDAVQPLLDSCINAAIDLRQEPLDQAGAKLVRTEICGTRAHHPIRAGRPAGWLHRGRKSAAALATGVNPYKSLNNFINCGVGHGHLRDGGG